MWKVIADKVLNFSVFMSRLHFHFFLLSGQPELHQANSYTLDMTYHPTNGHPDNHSPNSSHLSVQSGDAATLVSRTQKQQTTQQVCAVKINI